MGPIDKAMDRVRRGVDHAMIFTSLLLLAWPAMFADLGDPGAGVPT